MKRIFYALLGLGMLYACQKDDTSNLNPELIGSWKLIEVLADPGDGSGIFYAVESNKIITFKNDGTLTSNGNLCNTSISSESPTSGTYSKTEMSFKSADCDNPDYNFTFEKDGNILIINYPCIEPCRVKYLKE